MIEPQLAKPFNPERHDPDDYAVSRKFDGVRALWMGGELLTRNGKLLVPAKEWVSTLPPNVVLDGELVGSGAEAGFENTVSVVRSLSAGIGRWSNITYMLFDAPDQPGSFVERLEYLHQMWLNAKSRRFIEVARQHDDVGTLKKLYALLDKVIDDGGEGLMLRHWDLPYTSGRKGSGLLKLKKMSDMEAVVIAHIPGEGKHEGRLGALRCCWTHSGAIEFNVGTGFTDEQRENPPSVGSVITVAYQEMTAAFKPRFPVFMRVREDAGL